MKVITEEIKNNNGIKNNFLSNDLNLLATSITVKSKTEKSIILNGYTSKAIWLLTNSEMFKQKAIM